MLTSEEVGLDAASLSMRSATDLALCANIATAQVVLEHHLWLTMPEMKEADLVPFLDAPVSSGSLFGSAVEGFPDLRQLSRQPNQSQQPQSPDLRRSGEIEGSHAL